MPAADAFTAELRRPFGISVAAKLTRLREAGAERRRWSYAAPAATGALYADGGQQMTQMLPGM